MENHLEYFPEIIKASSTSALGILALIILIIGVLAYLFFRNERAGIKLTVFFTMVGLSLVSFAASFYNTEVYIPNKDQLADAGDTSDHSTSDQPAPTVPPAPSSPSVAMAPPARPAPPSAPMPRLSTRAPEPITMGSGEPMLRTTQPPAERIARSPGTLPHGTAAVVARQECGDTWSGWINIGKGVGNPCPAGCERGEELGKSIRMVGFPPRPQAKHKFQCWK